MNLFKDRHAFKRLIIPVMVWFCMHCTAPAFSQCGYGQSPDLAIPICNNDTIYQGAISPCTPRFVAGYDAQICINYNPQDYYTKKPMWYRIHCYNTGTLRFFLKYNNPGDLYVWQLFDITGSTANAVSTDPALTIRGNWGDNGIDYKGTAPGNFLLLGCAIGAPVILPPLNQMPILDAGHDYLLLVNHSDLTTDYGYKLVINGGTAVISDNTQPTLSKATGSCLLPQLVVKFSKSISCSSIAADGSDFSLNYPGVNIVQATSTDCWIGKMTDSVVLTLSAPLPKGNYNLQVKKGTDNNTLLDFCNAGIPEGNSIPFEFGKITAMIDGPAVSCPSELIQFTDISSGDINGWEWDFGNNTVSTAQQPPAQLYPAVISNTVLQVRLVVSDAGNCRDTAYHPLQLVNNCTITVPGGFTPNGDGLNDHLYPMNAWKARKLTFSVYDRSGQLVYFTNDNLGKWNGSFKGVRLPTGIYVWLLMYTDETGRKITRKGFATLIR